MSRNSPLKIKKFSLVRFNKKEKMEVMIWKKVMRLDNLILISNPSNNYNHNKIQIRQKKRMSIKNKDKINSRKVT